MARVDSTKVGKDFPYLPGEREYYEAGKLPDYPADRAADLPEPDGQKPTYFEDQGFLRPGPPFRLGHRCVLCGDVPGFGSWTCRAHQWGPGLRYGEVLDLSWTNPSVMREDAGVNHPRVLRAKESWGLPDDTNGGGRMPLAFPLIAMLSEEGDHPLAVRTARKEVETHSRLDKVNVHYLAVLKAVIARLEQALDWPKGRPDNPFGIRIAEPREEELQFPEWRAYEAGAGALLAGDAAAAAGYFAQARELWNANRRGSGDLGRALLEAAKVSAFTVP